MPAANDGMYISWIPDSWGISADKKHQKAFSLHLTLCRAQESFRGTTDDSASRWETCSTHMHPLSLTGWLSSAQSGSIPSEMVAIELRLDRILEKAFMVLWMPRGA